MRALTAALAAALTAALTAALMSALVAGCASTAPAADLQVLADVPARWSSGESGNAGRALEAAWWQRFDDPLLASLVSQALQHNTTLLIAQGGLRQARALRNVAGAGLLPTLAGSASAQRGMAGGRSTGNSFQAGLDASWELDLFGARRSALDSSQATLLASMASLGDAQVSVAAEVALAYITLRSAQVRSRIASSNLASQQETAQITDWRRQAGLVTSLEAEQARAAAEQTAAGLPPLATLAAQTQHALAVLTGQPPAALQALLSAAGPVPQAADGLALAIPADTLRQRADVRAAEWQVSAAASRVRQADAARLPNFTLGGSLGLGALTLGGLGNSAALVGSLLGSVSAPLFDAGAGRAQVAAQQAALDQQVATYRATVLAALQEVEDALVALAGDRERQRRLQAAADAASNAALLARQRYSGGLVDFQTVLETQRTQLSTQDNLATAGADLASRHVRLYKALGGGWQPDGLDAATLPTPATTTPTLTTTNRFGANARAVRP